MKQINEPQSAPPGLPHGIPATGADFTHVLGDYDCGNLDHEFSARLIRFKDLKGTFGRGADGRRHYQGFFAELLADYLLGSAMFANCLLMAPVPPKRGQDPDDYHLFDLASGLEAEYERRKEAHRLQIEFEALKFTGEVPPVKSIRLPDRPCALESRIACTMELSGRSVILLDDIIASGATAAECVRALREAGAEKVGLVALARRVA
jgi:predicted amidophosphoribosyltransferase